jgi:hypothetical protein
MPDLRGRLAIGLMSLLIAVGGIAVAIVAFLPTQGNAPVPQPTDQPIYTVTFPVDPVPVDGQPGHYSLAIETNLPDGTLLDSEYADSLAEGRGLLSCRGRWKTSALLGQQPLHRRQRYYTRL